VNRADARESLVVFLETIRRPDRPINGIDDGDSLVGSGLIDSLAVLQIVLYLENTHGIDFSNGGFDPADLGSINEILDMVERRAT